MKKQNKIKYHKVIWIILCSIIVTGCGAVSDKRSSQVAIVGNQHEVRKEKVRYNSEFLGVVKYVDIEKEEITILDIKSGIDLTLSYNGGTDVTNRYGDILAMSQIDVGEIVDVYFVEEKKKLIKLQKSKKAWEYQDVGNLLIDRTNKIMKISDRKYRYFDSLVIVNDGALRELIDLNKQDTLMVKGVGSNIYSITVTRGHGYIRLQDYKDFVGGFIEVGYGIIEPVSEDMLIVAKEGDYKLTMQNGNLTGSKMIHVARDQEIIVDMGEFKKEDNEIGKVDFIIEPEEAELRINGALIDHSKTTNLNYGRHTIKVTLDGYSEFNGVLKVGKEHQVIKINLAKPAESEVLEDDILEENNEIEDNNQSNQIQNTEQVNSESPNINNTPAPTQSQEPAQDNTNETNSDTQEDKTELTDVPKEEAPKTETIKVDSDHKISIKTPPGAKVYLNGTYKGTVPVDFPKEIGNHTITFQQDGYETKSYSVEIIDDGENAYLSYPNMIKK